MLRSTLGVLVLLLAAVPAAAQEKFHKERAEIANSSRADLFISIHINWLPDRNARGVETYCLGTTDDPFLTRLAAAENRDSGFSLADYRRLLEGIYADVRQAESRKLADQADAVIYLTDAIARHNDRALLDEFAQVTQGRSRAFNAVGVMAKIDVSRDVLDQRLGLAEEVARRLRDSLNTVVPVSAGLQTAVTRLVGGDGAGLENFAAAIRRIPAAIASRFSPSRRTWPWTTSMAL